MKILKRTFSIVLSLILTISLVGCGKNDGVVIPPTTDEVAYLVSTMTLREKIGQMMMLDFRKWRNEGQVNEHNVKVLSEDIETIIRDYNIGGLILFSENIVDAIQSTLLNNQIQRANGNGLPLFIGLDQEGGSITRIKEGLSMPGNMALGALDDGDYAFNSSSAVGKELRSRGFNMNFAPSVDVNSNPTNPIIGIRSFGSDPEMVSRLGVASMQGYQMQGVIPVLKHFPGHGDTSTDPHSSLPVVEKNIEDLWRTELKPFKSAINNGVDAIMTSHIQFPLVEPGTAVSNKTGQKIYLPATLSYEILTELLRREMGFSGVIVTDAMNMEAINANFTEEDAAVRAIGAGADILMMPTTLRSKYDVHKLDNIYVAIEDAIQSGSIKMSVIDDSVTRILLLKQKRGLLSNDQIFDAEVAESMTSPKGARDLERIISQEAITCLKNDEVEIDGNSSLILPFETSADTVVTFFTPHNREGVGIEYGIKRLKELYSQKIKEHNIIIYNDVEEVTRRTKKMLDTTDIAIIYTNAGGDYTKDNLALVYINNLLEILKEKNKPYVIVCGGVPYEAALFKDEPAVLVSYSMKGSSDALLEEELYPKIAYGPSIPAAMDVIFGVVANKGKLPVEIREIDENGKFTDEVCFKLGTGIELGYRN